MKLLTFFVACLCQLEGTEIRCEEETESQNAGFVKRVHRNTQRCKLVATRWTNDLNVTNILRSNSAVEYEGINTESTVVIFI